MTTPACPSCGKDSSASGDHCIHCGASLVPVTSPAGPPKPFTAVAVCSQCQTNNPLETEICGRCQRPLLRSTSLVVLFGEDGKQIGVVAGLPIRAAAYLLDWLLLVLIGVLVISSGVSIEKTEIQFSRADFVSVGLGLLYSVVCWSVWGRTLGKAVFGLKVIRPDGAIISPGRALWRYFWTLLSAFIVLLGYLMIVLRKDRRALHDLLADTYVVRISRQ